MPRYQTKPLPRDAIQFTGGAESAAAVALWAGDEHEVHHRPMVMVDPGYGTAEYLSIHTKGFGSVAIPLGYWAMRGHYGSIHSVNPPWFAENYELAPVEHTCPSHCDSCNPYQSPRASTS